MALAARATVPTNQTEHSEEWLVNLYRRAELFPTLAVVKQNTEATTFLRRTQRPLILVADDEPDMRRFLKSELE